jgi:DNA invertase Pin-like site-specific DNA recombinase
LSNSLHRANLRSIFPIMSLIEEVQAAAARRLADAADQLRAAEAEVRAAVEQAGQAEMSVNRIAGVAKVSRSTVYRWLRDVAEETDGPSKAPAKKPTPPRAKRAARG